MCAGTETEVAEDSAAEGRAGGGESRRPPAWHFAVPAAVCTGGVLALVLLGLEGSAPLAAPFAALWWMAVVVVVRSDLDRFIIPDAASGCIAGLGLVYALAEPLWEGFAPADALAEAVVAVLAGCGGFAALWLVGRLYRLASGHQGLGFGDVKLAGASAMWLTPADAVLALETAALAGLAVLLWRRRGAGDPDMALPFGAFLAPAAWLAFVVGPTLHRTLGHLG